MLTEQTIAACPYCKGECNCIMTGFDADDTPYSFGVVCLDACGYCGREMESEPEAVEVHNELCRNNAAVKKLPKTTNGVRQVPGETYWVIATDIYHGEEPPVVLKTVWWDKGQDVGYGYEYLSVDDKNQWEEFTVLGVYSTEELATAALAKGEQA